MNDIEHSEPRRPGPMPKKPRIPDLSAISWIPVIAVFLLIALPLFIWFGCRIEPRSGEIAVLIRKTGKDLPSGQILAMNPKEKGIQLEVLPEGRYFRNPYTWGWKIHSILDIPAGKLGVKTRLYGEALPVGKIIAPDGFKGVVREVLRPGKYRINPYAYTIELADAITIRPGHVGVVTALIGEDVLDAELPEPDRNTFLVKEGLKGVLTAVLDPGTYYLNPYEFSVVEVNLQSQRFEMSGADVITFLTFDGFTVTVEGTIEYVLQRDQAALLTHRVGDMDDIIKKVILPRARGFSRIEGSKHPAINFIVGETRQKFQNDLETHLREKCMDWGVSINSVLIRKIIVPDEIASIIREREIAVQNALKFDQQIEQAKSQAELVKQEMLAVQNKEKVEADTARIAALINARQDQQVRIIAAQQELDVAKLDNEAAAFRAEAVLARAAGDKDAIEARNLAEASVLASQVSAFGNGMNLARYRFYEKIAPQIGSVLSSDQKQGMGAIFGPLLPEGKGGAQ
ncbi:MAG TPA: SPFH domain-containing protein [Kiritimatiellia bacterium]|nr:SPFH domain-containing protein [Kiritimatiellia bacterium]